MPLPALWTLASNHVEYEQHHYSVPHPYVGKTLELHAFDNLFEVWADGQMNTSHSRRLHPGNSTAAEHMPESHHHHEQWTSERLKSWTTGVGSDTLAWVSGRLANAEGLTRLKQIKLIVKITATWFRRTEICIRPRSYLRNMKTSVAHATSTETGNSIMLHTLMKLLAEMKLMRIAAALFPLMEQPGTYKELSFRERLALLVTRESLERDQRKQKRLLQKARLRLEASVHDIDYQPARHLERSRIAQLSQNEWGAGDITC